MPNAYTGRVITTLAVLWIALSAIYVRAPFSPFQWFFIDEPISWEHNLRPGIDMVGGTSLIYEIEGADEDAGADGRNLAQEVTAALKQRVDPTGVRNLIWRPQGNSRIEIQMPLTGDAAEAEAVRSRYLEAQERLQQYNVSSAQVVNAIENLSGDEREQALDELAMGYEPRREFYRELAQAYDAVQSAQEQGIAAEAEARRNYQQLLAQLGQYNLTIEELQAAVEATADVRPQRLEEIRQANQGFPERLEAIDAFVEAYDAFATVRDRLGDTAELKRLLQGSGVLEFHILATDIIGTPRYLEYVERLQTVGPRSRAGDELKWFAVDNPEEFGGPTVQGPDGNAYVLAWITPERSMVNRPGEQEWSLERAYATTDNAGLSRVVGFEFDPIGGRLFGELTAAHLPRADGFRYQLAIILDERLVSAPALNTRITDRGIIEGGQNGFTSSELNYLVRTLNAGALPARLSEEPIVERTVGPQLGADNLRAGLIACIAGLVIVAFFLISYYYLAGVVAMIAVLMNMAIILGGMAALNATFTLPGIAGIILSLGMAVDANVLIFERLREEQARGLSIRMALRNAYDRALSAILDSNITTGITALVLYIFGTEEVAGFGLTLLIGLFASLFTALFVTKTIFGLLVDKAGLNDLGSIPRTFPKWDRMLTPRIDWMGKAPLFGVISGVFILLGLSLFGWAWAKGNILDIEFASGTSVQFELNEPAQIDEVREALQVNVETADNPLAGGQVVSVEPAQGVGPDLTYEVVVPNAEEGAVQAAVLERLAGRLNILQPSQFEYAGQPFAQVENVTVFPVQAPAEQIAGIPVNAATVAENDGGVAVVLRNLQPRLAPEEIERRINQQRLQGTYRAAGLRGSVNVDVASFTGEGGAPGAIVYVSNPNFAYNATSELAIEQWEAELAAPVWELVSNAVNNPPQLQKVTNFGPTVAREFAIDATIALVLSILGIMAYIWIRFGDFKHSSATVIALAHDTLAALAAIGFAHLLTNTFIGDVLLLDPFRINLTVVASVLTVMGFSMNDTVVVFDRIRENRGKYGVMTRQVINDSINQTLSRTLLTGGTTLITILVMYIFGGPGIHGFTYVMLIGIIAGTYSSIAIASPLLLIRLGQGAGQQDTPAAQPALAAAK